ncbi:MAG: hypothetical protein CME70_21465 [Halobacteriovorax sp.]|nr:hypothetical protein [Halobacteriovorax sp.]
MSRAKKYKTIMSKDLALPHFEHAKKCTSAFSRKLEENSFIDKKVEEYKQNGFCEIWTEEQSKLADKISSKVLDWDKEGKYFKDGIINIDSEIYNSIPEIEVLIKDSFSEFLQKSFNSEYKVFFSQIIKTEFNNSGPRGSQLWHQDGGPGSAINALFYLRDIDKDGGAIELIPWKDSLKIYKKVISNLSLYRLLRKRSAKEQTRSKKVELYEKEINPFYSQYVHQPTGKSGLLVPFFNNVIHRGGFPKSPDKPRFVLLFYFYPSDKKTPFEKYRKEGFPKKSSYPKDPNF